MERITKKADKKSRDVALEKSPKIALEKSPKIALQKNPQCLLSNSEKNPQCLLCLNTEINESLGILKTLTKSDLIKIIQNKNDLILNYANWSESLVKKLSEKEKESK